MNLLDILSSGKRLREENVSSLLAWLLDPTQSHGCGPLFLESLVEVINKTNERKLDPSLIKGLPNRVTYRNRKANQVTVQVIQEFQAEKGRYVDIVIFLNEGKETKHILAIENKTQEKVDKEQPIEEYNGLKLEHPGIPISFLYLTPSKSTGFIEAFDQLPSDATRLHMTWTKVEERPNDKTFVDILREVLGKDVDGRIEQLSPDVKSVLKWLIQFAERGFNPPPNEEKSILHLPGGKWYKGIVKGLDGIQTLLKVEGRKDVFIGFYGGVTALEKADIAELRDRPFKWNDNLQNKSWIPASEFERIIKQKENA